MIDPILTLWILIWTSISSYGFYLLLSDNKQASEFYIYGKSLDVSKKKGLFWNLFLVPKRYFTHFYINALLILLPSILIIILYYLPTDLRETLLSILKIFEDEYQKYFSIETTDDLVTITALIFTTILLIIQCSRRLYESLFVSVFSNTSKMNVLHYIFGNSFYILATLSTILPILLSRTSNKYSLTDLIDKLITKGRAIEFILFIYATHHQHKCHVILANLRKDKSGRVITDQHYVPSGGLFQYVSCPHFLMETILYLIIVLIQEFKNVYWNLIFILVLTTQIINAITDHRWYKRKYKDYPKERKAIFPFLL